MGGAAVGEAAGAVVGAAGAAVDATNWQLALVAPDAEQVRGPLLVIWNEPLQFVAAKLFRVAYPAVSQTLMVSVGEQRLRLTMVMKLGVAVQLIEAGWYPAMIDAGE